MSKLRITNVSKGPRGVWIAGVMEEVGSGKTRTFSKFTAEDKETLAANKDFRVQSGDDGAWEELSKFEAPPQRPYLVLATDSKGGNFRVVELREGEWFLGTAVASDRPELAGGYSYAKIGGEVAPLTEAAAIASGEFDPVAFLNTAAKNLDFTNKPQEMLTLLLETEKANKDRSGVIATIEELLTEPKSQRVEFEVSDIDPETTKKALEK